MAIIKSIGVGKASGSVGEFTYSTVEGRTIARSKPAFVSNPNTPAQQAQRNRMRNIVFLWSLVGQRFGKLWTKRAKYNSPYNAFVSKNIQNEENFAVNIEDGSYQMFRGLYLGEGVYSRMDVKTEATEGTLGLSFTELSPLITVTKVGDKVGMIQLDDSGRFISETVKTLTESDVATLVNGDPLMFAEEDADGDVFAPYWISADGQKSTTVIV